MIDHNQTLVRAQLLFDVGPTGMAKLLNTNHNTYKAWLYNVNPAPGIVYAAIDALLKVAEFQDLIVTTKKTVADDWSVDDDGNVTYVGQHSEHQD